MFKTIHIFGYGECQSISETHNKKVSIEECQSVQSVVDMIYSHKPSDSNIDSNYWVITIFDDSDAKFQTIDGVFNVDYSLLDHSLINQLNEEITK